METWGRKWATPTRWVWRFLSTHPKNCSLLTLRTCPRNFTVIMILVFLFSVGLDYWIFWDINVHPISALISYFWNWIDKLNSNHSNSIKIKSHKFLNANRPDIWYMYICISYHWNVIFICMYTVQIVWLSFQNENFWMIWFIALYRSKPI